MPVNIFGMNQPTSAFDSFMGGMDAVAGYRLKNAQAQREQALAKLPFGGTTLPGVAGQIQGLETVRQLYGENSPQYQSAKQMYDLNMQSTQSRIGYQDALTGSMGVRYLTPTGKSAVEQARVQNNLAPTGQSWQDAASPQQNTTAPLVNPDQPAGQSPQPGVPPSAAQAPDQSAASPPFASQLSDQYDLLRQKSTTDVDARKRNLFATNIDKTLAMIDPQQLTQYAGMGAIKKAANQYLLAPTGSESSNYDSYKKNQIAAQMLATQVRQFYGDSVQPEVQEKLAMLTDPAIWSSNPKIATQNFNQLKTILSKETQTYRDAVQSRAPYLGNTLPQSPAQTQKINMLQQQAGITPPGATPSMPNFNSKQEFQAWFAKQTPNTQAQIRANLGGQ